ncbi:hypothetical protein GTY54_07035 [Streptomyces sp. SID625]|nr:hypothetical protein [Streptomyces sp. SID625]
MTALLHISHCTTQHHPLASVSTWWAAFRLGHSQRAVDASVESGRLALPVADFRQRAWENPAGEVAFAHPAGGHPKAATPADGSTAARETDCKQMPLAVCDRHFHEAHPAPGNRWPPDVLAAYQRLDDVCACFHPTGGAA